MTDGRLYAALNIELPKGSSVAIEFDGNTSGTFNVYAALIGYVKDIKNK
jgi:effector-binding domain-containing protein